MNKDSGKILGILGGMAWPSTLGYYRDINRLVEGKRGRQCSAEILLRSVNFQKIIDWQVAGEWQKAAKYLLRAGEGLEKAGAGAFLIASNTMHLVYEELAIGLGIPGISIIDATSNSLKRAGYKKVGFLGTRYTMQNPYFVSAYQNQGIDLLFPEAKDKKKINAIIFKELIHAKFTPSSQEFYLATVGRLKDKGAEAIVLGCTEIGMLFEGVQADIEFFDTAKVHSQAAADWLLS